MNVGYNTYFGAALATLAGLCAAVDARSPALAVAAIFAAFLFTCLLFLTRERVRLRQSSQHFCQRMICWQEQRVHEAKLAFDDSRRRHGSDHVITSIAAERYRCERSDLNNYRAGAVAAEQLHEAH